MKNLAMWISSRRNEKKNAYFAYFILQFQNPICSINYKSSCKSLWHISTLKRVVHKEQSNVRMELTINGNAIKLQFQNKTSKSITTLKFSTWKISYPKRQLLSISSFFRQNGVIYLTIFPMPDKKIIWNLLNCEY